MKKSTTILIIILTIITLVSTGCFESESPPELGDYAHHFLSDDKYNRIIVEIDYVGGFEPSSQALDTLESRLATYCDKPEGVLILEKEISTLLSSYSLDDLRDLEDEHRDYNKKGSDIVAYILYLDGEYSENSDAVGLAYGPSSIAIFKQKIDSISIPIWAQSKVSTEDYEKSVLVHEFGHLLALVNIGYESDRNHEDSNVNHCKFDDCVMYYSIETVSIKNHVKQETPKPPSDFCQHCKYDLNKLKSGGY